MTEPKQDSQSPKIKSHGYPILRSTVSATKYMRETNKSSSAEPLGERAMLVKTRRLELGRKGCEASEPNQDS